MDEIVLKYVGDGAFVNGVPARDLTQTDIEQSGHRVEQLLAFEPRVYERQPAANPESAPKRAARSIDSSVSGSGR